MSDQVKVYYAYNPKVKQIVEVLFDQYKYVYFDPVDESEYDYPHVYHTHEEAVANVPALLLQKINDIAIEISKLTTIQVDTGFILYTKFLNHETFYYLDVEKLQTRACYRKNNALFDIITQQELTVPVNLHKTREDCFNELIGILNLRHKEVKKT